MNKQKQKHFKRGIRKNRSGSKICGTKTRPRVCVFRSLKYIYAQFVDDETGKVLVSETNRSKKLKGKKTEQAFEVGKLLAKKAIEAGIQTCVFDRSGYLYHGRVKALAEGLREGGLKF